MIKNFSILINDLALKTTYEKMIAKHKLEIQDIKAELQSMGYKSPLKYETYLKENGEIGTWIPPKSMSPLFETENPKKEKLFNRIDSLETDIKLLSFRLKEIDETMQYIKIKNEFLFKMLQDCYSGEKWDNKIFKKYFYSNFYTFKKAAQRMFYKIF